MELAKGEKMSQATREQYARAIGALDAAGFAVSRAEKLVDGTIGMFTVQSKDWEILEQMIDHTLVDISRIEFQMRKLMDYDPEEEPISK